MRIVEEFQRKFGSRWTGVRFLFGGSVREGRCFPNETRFCEAVSRSWSSNELLTGGCSNCMGANYVFGWENNVDKVIENYHKKRNISIQAAADIVKCLPRMEAAPLAIGFNGDESPDLLVACLQPQQFMKLLDAYQKVFGGEMKVDLTSFAAVCGGVAVRAYLTEKISLSFGCDDSRQYGGISRDRLIVGIPYAQAYKLLA